MKSLNAIEEQNLIRLGNYIKKARQDSGMSLRSLATLSRVNYKTIHCIENAQMKRIDPNSLVRISSVLKLDLSKMLTFAGYFELVFRLKYSKEE